MPCTWHVQSVPFPRRDFIFHRFPSSLGNRSDNRSSSCDFPGALIVASGSRVSTASPKKERVAKAHFFLHQPLSRRNCCSLLSQLEGCSEYRFRWSRNDRPDCRRKSIIKRSRERRPNCGRNREQRAAVPRARAHLIRVIKDTRESKQIEPHARPTLEGFRTAGHGLMHNAALGNAHREGLKRAQKSHRRLSRCFITRNWLLHSFRRVSRHRAREWDLRKVPYASLESPLLLRASPPPSSSPPPRRALVFSAAARAFPGCKDTFPG